MADQTSDEQNAEMLNVPCIYVNRIFLGWSTDGYRLSFAEQTPDQKAMVSRCAVLLSQEGIAQLKELCEIVLTKAEEIKKHA